MLKYLFYVWVGIHSQSTGSILDERPYVIYVQPGVGSYAGRYRRAYRIVEELISVKVRNINSY
jgi:hypothetical protein